MNSSNSRTPVLVQKRELQDRLDRRAIANLAELLEDVRQAGLQITRLGRHYIGLRRHDGARFRLKFDFGISGSARAKSVTIEQSHADRYRAPLGSKERYYAIYALLAYGSSSQTRACYIGQSVNMMRRLREHLARNRGRRGSCELFEWAAKEELQVLCIVLMVGQSSQAAALSCEREWLLRALCAGFEAPGAERWAKTAAPAYGDRLLLTDWPDKSIRLAAKPIADVVALRSPLPLLEAPH